MNHATLSAEDLYTEMKRMPTSERVRFFSLLANNAFREDDFTHEQVFGGWSLLPVKLIRQCHLPAHPLLFCLKRNFHFHSLS